VPRCADVRRLAGLPGVVALAMATRPQTFWLGGPINVPEAGVYEAWLGGDWHGLAAITADGREVGSKRGEINWPGTFTELGSVRLTAGAHLVTSRYETGGWRPGSGARRSVPGSAALSRDDAREPVETIPASRARSLCGRRLDWVEALR
jgi:hypothetical protein